MTMANDDVRPSFLSGTLYAEISPEDKAQLEKKAKEVTFKKGDFVIAQGSTAKGVYFITKGKVKSYVTDKSGRETIVNLEGPGAAVGLMTGFFLQDTKSDNRGSA